MYPTIGTHPPMTLGAAAVVKHQMDPSYGECDVMNNIRGYEAMARWVHVTDNAIDFVFHICPFG
jgi:hypothetical protein